MHKFGDYVNSSTVGENINVRPMYHGFKKTYFSSLHYMIDRANVLSFAVQLLA